MVEKLWIGGARSIFKTARKVSPAAWVVLVVTLLITTRAAKRFLNHHIGHRDEIVEAIGSMGFFYGPPQPDHSNSILWYLRTSEKGLGLYRCLIGTGQTAMIHEWEPPEDRSLNGQRLLPLSPDDRFLPAVISTNATGSILAIYDADTGTELTRIGEPGWTVSQSAWITPDKLIWSRYRTKATDKPQLQIHLTQRQSNAEWTDTTERVLSGKILGLFALSTNSIAAADSEGIHALDLSTTNDTILFRPQDGQISDVDFCWKTGQFLITAREKSGFSIGYSTSTTDIPSDVEILVHDKRIQNARWVNDGKGFAYLNEHTLKVKSYNLSEPGCLVPAAVDKFTAAPAANDLFLIGMTGNQPGLGLWQYDTERQTLTNIIGYSEKPSSYTVRAEPFHCLMTVPNLEPISFYLYKPVRFDAHKKYPLLIGNTIFGQLAYQHDFDGPSWAEAIANCGAYVVIVERNKWFIDGDRNMWGKNIMAVYDKLKNDSTVDTSAVFLYATSIETDYLSQWIGPKPKLWKGIILFNPAKLPDVSVFDDGVRLPKILLSTGKDEHESERLQRYQAEACQQGVQVTVIEHPNAGHVLTSNSATMDRIRALCDFVFN